ncbi:Phosphomevalonate kinase [Hesseltinella vesiculosa]|uniref:Phosphomevalonate kinase n=1 Tax=Hesseltinella vesiculosa TaxID=101127 RepID=A0A1X2G839_9FUNG|nr:Phosphomevalonate kinase [Hesseltinella vesiculosa]
MTCTIASAPGKVLVTGGYLVLDQQYLGLVFGTSARFFTVIQNGELPNTITVRSPQFEQATWHYEVQSTLSNLIIQSSADASSNKFVETCLRYTLKVILEKVGAPALDKIAQHGLDICIVGDNDFYSQREELNKLGLSVKSATARQQLVPFCKTHATLATVNKTGLGSSAALTTSLVAALLLHLGALTSVESPANLALVHNVAQFVHCYAQGKVGSGFDVSSAVYGSHRYKRFSPDLLNHIMKEDIDGATLCKVLESDNHAWDNQVDPVALPPHFQMILADIDAGSHTPTLVSKVLKWRKEQPVEADALWQELGSYNDKVAEHFRALSSLHAQDHQAYLETISAAKDLPSSEWPTVQGAGATLEHLIQLVADFSKVRQLLQKMSTLTDVPIEPSEQTELLDRCMAVPGTLMAGVPGAGGYDAIFCVVLSDQAKERVQQVWEQWEGCNISPLLCQADSNGVTKVDPTSQSGVACLNLC